MVGRVQINRCLKKRRFWSNVEALEALTVRLAKGAPPLTTYECPSCRGWHLTSKIKAKK